MTERERDQAAERVFAGAVEKATRQEQIGFLDDACAGQPQLREWVDALLAAHAEAGGFLQGPAAALGEIAAAGPKEEEPGGVIGRYKLLEPIGEGGMGVVFMAQQQHPVRRKVALKVIKAGMDSRQVVARFEAERQALAMMDHPSIAKVLDGGTTRGGRPYFVMELVQGVPITDYCDRNELTARHRLELFLPVCHAVQHAHSKGVIHRDLKPGNVLVTLADGVPVPKVIDFGIAKAAGQELTDKTLFTQFAQMVGTPLYMSPEQAGGGADVDTRSDVYSLGVLLYELLTGTTPFDRKRLGTAGFDEVRRIIRDEDPPRPSARISTLGTSLATVSARRNVDPRRLGPLLRGELDWIVMRSLEKDRNRRYESVNGLALDVERYLNDEPVQACPPSARYRFGKYARRHRVVLSTAVVIGAVLLLATGVSSWQAVRARTAESAARRSAAELALDKGQLLGERGDANLALLWLSRALKLAPADALDLQAAVRLGMGSWQRRVDSVRWAAAFNGIQLFVGFGRDGDPFVASVEAEGRVSVWRGGNVSGRADPTRTFMLEPSDYVAVSPAGDYLVTGAAEGVLRLTDMNSGRLLWQTRQAGASSTTTTAFSADGKLMVAGFTLGPARAYQQSGRAQVYDVATGQPRGPALEHPRPVYAAAFHPDGRSFVTECGNWSDGTERVNARFWDLEGRETRGPLEHAGMSPSVAFSPGGDKLLVGLWNRTATLWDLADPASTGPPARPIVMQHEGPVIGVSFGPDGRKMMTASFDGSVRLWDATGRLIGSPLRQGRLVEQAAFSPDGSRVLVGVRGNVARLWELAPQVGTASSEPRPAAGFPLAVSPDGRTILVQDADLAVRVRDAATFEPVGKPLPHERPLRLGGTSILPGHRAACSSDRRRALTIEQDTAARLWDVQTGELVAELKVDPEDSTFFAAAFNHDGKVVVTGNFRGTAYVWHAETGNLLRELPHEPGATVFSLAFLPGQATLLASDADGAVRFWDVDSGDTLGAPLMHNTPVFTLALSPDGRTILTGDVDSNVQLWDLGARRRLRNFTGHQGGIHDVAFSADGRFALTGSRDHTARLWDVATGKPIGPPMTHTGPVIRVAFARDGRSIRTALQDQTAHEWAVPTPVSGGAAELEVWAEAVTGMQVNDDGGVQILDAGEWAKRKLELEHAGFRGAPGIN